jgi:hypothetical protein
MGDDITIGVTEIVNNIQVTAQPNDQVIDINVTDNSDEVTLNITPTVVEININKGSSYAVWGGISGNLTDQTDLANALILKADLVDGKVPSYQLPSYVDDVVEVANFAALPVAGETGKIYVTLDNNKIYRWSGSVYIEISASNSVWGAITGTLSSQTDLQNALNAKFDDPIGDTTQYIDGTGALQTFPVLASADKLILVVRNMSGATITKGTVVYINGASGNKPTIAKALATGDSTSAQTLGLVQANIANNSNGNVVLVGSIIDLDTSAFTDGQQLYLSGVTAGTYTATKTLAPTHLVYVGVVARSHPTQGVIEVKIQNGYELDEIHDVAISSLVNNEFLVYESASDLWKNKSLGTVLGGISTQFVKGNGSLDSNVYALDNVVVKLTGNQTIGGIKSFFNDFIVNDINIGRGGSNVASNTVFGAVAGFSNTTGDDNSFFGYQAGYLNTSGQGNTFLGRDAGQKNTSGNANSFFGFYASGENTTGGNNVSFGYSAGRFIANGSTVNGISNESIFLGAQSKALASNQSNQIVIGYGAIGVGSNSVTLGNDSITKTILKGNVGIGTTSPSDKLTVSGGSIKNIISGSTSSHLQTTNTLGSTYFGNDGNGGYLYTDWNAPFLFYTNNTEKMRITSGGELCVGTTTAVGAGLVNIKGAANVFNLLAIQNTITTGNFIYFINSNGTQAGAIQNLSGGVLYTTVSDYRLKEDFKNYSGLDLISQIKTYDYKWKESEDRMYGVKAHELQEVVPYAVTGEKDAKDMQSVDYSKLVPILVQAIQDQQKQINELKILKNK